MTQYRFTVAFAAALTLLNLILINVRNGPEFPPAFRSASTHQNYGTGISELYGYEPARIAVVQIADEKFKERNETQINSVKCWAQKNGYQYILTHPNDYPVCSAQLKKTGDFWHSQLCALYELLIHNEDYIDYILKLDTDVVAGMSEHGVEHFLDGADFIVQERLYTAEINAGCYFIRNTLNGRRILRAWYEWPVKHALGPGYRGGDNGSIHQVINNALSIKGSEICQEKYDGIKYMDPMSTYFEYVACTREFLGPARRHLNPYSGVRVTVWPAGYGPMMDYHTFHYRANAPSKARDFYLFAHGIKEPIGHDTVLEDYGDPLHWGDLDFFDGHCIKWEKPEFNDLFAQKMANDLSRGFAQRIGDITPYHEIDNRICFLESAADVYEGIPSNYHFRVPRWNLYDSELAICQEDYWKCRPLDHDEYSEVPGWKCTEPSTYVESAGGRDFNPVELTNIGPHVPEYI